MISTASSSASGEVTQTQIDSAVRRLKNAIYSMQRADGSFETKAEDAVHRAGGGDTALAIYALLQAGESYQDPRLQPALKWLAEQEIHSTYALGIRCHVWSHLPDQFLEKLREDVYTLDQWKAPPAGAQNGAIGWAYGYRMGPVHTSTGQYGVLGFWEGAKRGLPISKDAWNGIEAYYTTGQNDDGGWGYAYKGESKLSMTCAGLTCLYITRDYAHRDEFKQPGFSRNHPLTAQLDKGLAYMDKHYAPAGGGAFPWYTLYGCERVGLASGRRYFGNKDWFATGAEFILAKMGNGNGPFPALQSHGHAAAGHAFALLFLVRGGVPVMINKLEIPGYDWNNRPRDMASLTEWVSDTVEQEINWQVQSIDQKPEQWMDAPLLYITSQAPLELNDQQKARLKRYIDMGGLLITAADKGSIQFTRSVNDLMTELYPSYAYKDLSPDDELCKTVFQVEPGRLGVKTMHNGVRHIAIHIPRGDVSWTWHTQSQLDPAPWQLMLNTYYYATSKRGSRPRLGPHVIERTPGAGDKAPAITVARVVYEGNHDPEPLSWETQANFMYNEGKAKLETTSVELDHLRESGVRFAHVVGTAAVEFSDAQVQAIQSYANSGGTILFENAGGRSTEFVESVMAMVLKAFPGSRIRPVALSSPVITGEGIGGYNVAQVDYCPYTLLKRGRMDAPQLMAVSIDDQPRIFISGDDLSHAMLGQTVWGVFGYESNSAHKIVSNLVLYANR
ncbi:MAG: DUF4159 domain-containing protein [Phycisphaera sp.]|nr:DUF4159 domain-containing protein [Phycisphaera sp.]